MEISLQVIPLQVKKTRILFRLLIWPSIISKMASLYLQFEYRYDSCDYSANKTKTKALDASVILQFASLLSEGIPLNCEIKDGTAAIYADKDLILPLIKSAFSSEEIVELIIAQVPAGQQEMVKAIFDQLPELIKTTTEFNAGLNLEKE